MHDRHPPAKPRVAFVVQRCGREVNGGAEALCLQVATHMTRYWHTEIVTTCALDYMSWENYYPEEPEIIASTTVRRFSVDYPRDVGAFDKLSISVREAGSNVSLAQQEEWMRAQGPISSKLFSYLAAKKEDYDAFVFFGYLYASTYFGLPLVAEKAFLVPCAHDEWPIHLPMWDTFMQLPHGLIFNTPEEKKFFRRRFSTAERDGPTIGIGVDAPTEFHVPPFLRKYSLHDPFLLYVGRIDASKGCAELFDFFRRLRESDTEPRKLVLLGNEVMTVPYHPDIIRLGFVADQEKFAAMAACDWLVNPSPYESLSIVLLETWLAGRPALVNAACEVLVGQCRRSNGGLWYSNYAEWQQAILSVDSATRSMIGQQGKEYVEREYSWDRIESCYRAAVDANGTSPHASSAVSVSAP